MKEFFEDIKKSLDSENYYAALFMALCIPDICLFMKMGHHTGNDYVNWFESFMPSYKGYMTGKDCYAFRCAILHEGKSNVLNQRQKDVIEKFEILSKKKSAHLGYIGSIFYNDISQPTKLIINLHIFCKDLIKAAEEFIKQNNLKIKDFVEIKDNYNDGFIKM